MGVTRSMGLNSSKYTIFGKVSEGYESVRELFEDNFKKGRDDKAQLCVYVGNECVIDLWGTTEKEDDDYPNYNADTLTTWYSNTKSLTAIVVAMMVDRGLLDYNKRIMDYWPEFGAHGKDTLTIADLMRHEAGLAYFDTTLKQEDTLVENIKKNKIGEIVERQSLEFPTDDTEAAEAGVPGKRQYHSKTLGWIANEIVRRIHPDGLTIGEILQKDIARPLKANVFIGVDEEHLDDFYPGQEVDLSSEYVRSMLPSILGGGEYGYFRLVGILKWFKKVFAKEGRAIEGKKRFLSSLFASKTIRMGECPSSNGNSSARGLASVASVMANRGEINGVKLLSKPGWEEMHSDLTLDFLMGPGFDALFTKGGVAYFPEQDKFNGKNNARKGFYGWIGYGGCVFQWHPDLNIGFAYTPTLLEWFVLDCQKAARLQEEVVKCVMSKIKDL